MPNDNMGIFDHLHIILFHNDVMLSQPGKQPPPIAAQAKRDGSGVMGRFHGGQDIRRIPAAADRYQKIAGPQPGPGLTCKDLCILRVVAPGRQQGNRVNK